MMRFRTLVLIATLVAVLLLAPRWAGAVCCFCNACTGPQVCFSVDECTPSCQDFACPSGATTFPDPAVCGQGSGPPSECTVIDPPTPTPTATATATPTSTPTPVQQGGACSDASQCTAGLFCSDGTCCDTACTGAGESCDVPGQEGTCVTVPAGAPAASNTGLLAMIGALFLIAFVALRARRHL